MCGSSDDDAFNADNSERLRRAAAWTKMAILWRLQRIVVVSIERLVENGGCARHREAARDRRGLVTGWWSGAPLGGPISREHPGPLKQAMASPAMGDVRSRFRLRQLCEWRCAPGTPTGPRRGTAGTPPVAPPGCGRHCSSNPTPPSRLRLSNIIKRFTSHLPFFLTDGLRALRAFSFFSLSSPHSLTPVILLVPTTSPSFWIPSLVVLWSPFCPSTCLSLTLASFSDTPHIEFNRLLPNFVCVCVICTRGVVLSSTPIDYISSLASSEKYPERQVSLPSAYNPSLRPTSEPSRPSITVCSI